MSKNFKNKKDLQKLMKEYTSNGHAAPVTRRQFVGAGLIQGAAFMALPSVLDTLVSRAAFAAGTCPSSSSTLPALVNINASGGACFTWDFPALDAGGNPLASYSKLGLGSAPTIVQSSFANKTKISSIGTMVPAIMSGIATGGAASTASVMAQTTCITVTTSSRDDNNTDLMSFSRAAIAAGLSAKIAMLGSRSTVSTGVSSLDAFSLSSVTPFVPNSITDVMNALGSSTTGAFGSLSVSEKASAMRLIANINGDEATRLAAANGGSVASNLIGCATTQNGALVVGPPVGDPRTSPIASIWGLASNTTVGGQNSTFAAMTLAALQGNSGPIGLELGGYDYHGQGQANQDTMHQQLGTLIGKVLGSAAVMNKDCVIWLTTDGATASAVSTTAAPPQGDSGNNSMNILFMYRASAAKIPSFIANQVGYFNQSQQSDAKSPTDDISQCALAGFANYLQFGGQISSLSSVLTVDSTVLTKLLAIG